MKLKNSIADILMILAATVATLSLLAEVTLDFVLLPGRLNWLIFTLGIYLLRFGAKFPIFKVKHPLIPLFILIIVWESVQAILQGRNIGFTYFIQIFTYLVFLAYFQNLTVQSVKLRELIIPYCYYYIISFVVILLTAVLLVAGVLSPTDNPITSIGIMNSNIDSGTYYFWPGHLSVVSLSTRIELFENVPLLCGFSHEPHVLALSIYPAFLLLLYYIKDRSFVTKLVVYFSIFLIQLFSFSTTSLFSLGIVLLLDFISSRSGSNKVFYAFLIVIGITYLASQFNIFDQIVNVSGNKLSGTDDSKDYSTGLLLYGLSPSGILGEGIYLKDETATNFSLGNVGLISCILCTITYILFAITAFKNFRSKNQLCHYIGMATLYFSIHSIKLGCLIYNYPIMFYMIYILSYSDNIRKNENAYEKQKI